MNLILKLLALPHWWFVVKSKDLPSMIEYLRIDLKERGCVQQSDISDEIMILFIREAYSRAAMRGKDKPVRYGGLYETIESVGKEMDAAFDAKPDVDPKIRSMLEFHRLISDNSGDH